MNYGISVLFRTIPLLMALFCFGYGAFVLDMGTDPAKNVAGPVVMSLGMICIALFATAATIIRQIIHTYNTVVLYALPVLGYLAALLTFICGWEYISEAATASHFVAGHVICGVAFITACVATTATSSTRFTLIPANSQTTENDAGQGHAFSVFIKFFRLQLGVAGIPDKEEVFVFQTIYPVPRIPPTAATLHSTRNFQLKY